MFQPKLNSSPPPLLIFGLINKTIVTIVNRVSNHLYFRKGTFFDVLKRCYYPFNSHFCKGNRKIVLTELTAYNSHHID
jgi:hypothetical protein